MTVHLVVTSNGMVLAAYETEHHARVHALTVTGAVVTSVVVSSSLTKTVRDDLEVETEWNGDGDTPVEPEPDP